MAKDAYINVRIDSRLKNDVDQILAELGLSASEVINMLYAQIKLRGAIPFEVKLPDERLIEYLQKTETEFVDHDEILKEYGLPTYLEQKRRKKAQKT